MARVIAQRTQHVLLSRKRDNVSSHGAKMARVRELLRTRGEEYDGLMRQPAPTILEREAIERNFRAFSQYLS